MPDGRLTALRVQRRAAAAHARRERFAWVEGVETFYKMRSLTPGATREHTLDIIENSRLYFPSPTEFNDPFDCFPPFDLAGDWRDSKFVQELPPR
jgi:hypothetical protein